MTIDAMGCQSQVASEIKNADADYVLALKANQGTCLADAELFFADALRAGRGFGAHAHDTAQSVKKDHGRLETRQAWSVDARGWLDPEGRFEGLCSLGMVRSHVEELVSGKTRLEERYFISSLPVDAPRLLGLVRGHWGIESSCHWVLDVDLGDDAVRVRERTTAQNWAALRRLALNLLRQAPEPERTGRKRTAKSKPLSLNAKQLWASWNEDYLLSILRQ